LIWGNTELLHNYQTFTTRPNRKRERLRARLRLFSAFIAFIKLCYDVRHFIE